MEIPDRSPPGTALVRDPPAVRHSERFHCASRSWQVEGAACRRSQGESECVAATPICHERDGPLGLVDGRHNRRQRGIRPGRRPGRRRGEGMPSRARPTCRRNGAAVATPGRQRRWWSPMVPMTRPRCRRSRPSTGWSSGREGRHTSGRHGRADRCPNSPTAHSGRSPWCEPGEMVEIDSTPVGCAGGPR